MQLFTLGLNHQTAPARDSRARGVSRRALRSALAELTLREPVREAAILSTCNRTELYCALGEPQAALEWLAGYHSVQPQELKPYLYTLSTGRSGSARVPRRLRLDSMVVGEPQILGQMKEAVRVASRPVPSGRFSTSFSSALLRWRRKCASNTGIGANVVSMVPPQ